MSSQSALTTTSTKYAIGGGMLAAGLAIGAMFSPLGLAGAQDDGGEDSPVEGTAPRGDRSGRPGHHRHIGDALEELGLTEDQVRAGIEADQSLAEIAVANGITEAELTAALETEAAAHLAEAVESGRVSQEEADERLADLGDRIEERINQLPSERQALREERRENRLSPLTDLGLTAEEIRAGHEAGQSLAETAEANGISEEVLVDALVAAATERAEAAVENGRADADEVAERLADIEERITERVNAEPGDRPGRFGRGGR